MKHVIATLALLSGSLVLATETRPSPYSIDGKPVSKAQAVLTGIQSPDSVIMECHQVQVDRETLRIKRVKSAKKQSND